MGLCVFSVFVSNIFFIMGYHTNISEPLVTVMVSRAGEKEEYTYLNIPEADNAVVISHASSA